MCKDRKLKNDVKFQKFKPIIKIHWNEIILLSFIVLLGLAAVLHTAYNYKSVIYYILGLVPIISFYTVNRQYKLQSTFSKIPISQSYPKAREYQIIMNRMMEGKSINPTKDEIESIGNESYYEAVSFYLGVYDDIGVGVLEGTLNEDLVKKLDGRYMIKTYKFLSQYLKQLAEQPNPARYPGLEGIMKRWGASELS